MPINWIDLSDTKQVKTQLEETWDIDVAELVAHYLDLLSYRDVSNYIAETSGIYHQSPQILLFNNGKVVMDASHHAIKVESIKKGLAY